MYGLTVGKVFFGESMFSAESNASKVALLGLCQQLVEYDFALLDCQVVSQHLMTLGATTIPRSEFAQILSEACSPPIRFEQWSKNVMDIHDLLPV